MSAPNSLCAQIVRVEPGDDRTQAAVLLDLVLLRQLGRMGTATTDIVAQSLLDLGPPPVWFGQSLDMAPRMSAAWRERVTADLLGQRPRSETDAGVVTGCDPDDPERCLGTLMLEAWTDTCAELLGRFGGRHDDLDLLLSLSSGWAHTTALLAVLVEGGWCPTTAQARAVAAARDTHRELAQSISRWTAFEADVLRAHPNWSHLSEALAASTANNAQRNLMHRTWTTDLVDWPPLLERTVRALLERDDLRRMTDTTTDGSAPRRRAL